MRWRYSSSFIFADFHSPLQARLLRLEAVRYAAQPERGALRRQLTTLHRELRQLRWGA